MQLHFNATVRLVRRQIEWLTDARAELVESLADTRIPHGVAQDQIDQCDRELAEHTVALGVLHGYLAADEQMKLKLVAAA